jgi:hypothetical protein
MEKYGRAREATYDIIGLMRFTWITKAENTFRIYNTRWFKYDRDKL